MLTDCDVASIIGMLLAMYLVERSGLMLRITEQRVNGRLVLKLEGRFSAPWVTELEACWRAALEHGEVESIWVDLSDVCLVDVAGRQQLARMHREGARFLARGCVMPELVREISESVDVATER